MKATILVSLLFAGVSFAGLENWTNSEGVTVQLELVEVVDNDGEKSGVFKMRNGRTVTIKAADLAVADAARLAEWKPEEKAPAAASAGPSVFDKLLDGNLVKLDGRSLKAARDVEKPLKYYVFYYTASWCGPCQAFTPSLVDFYNEHKNANFELVLITSDRDEKAMAKYAQEKSMPWPQLKLSRTDKFKSETKHGVTGIPSLIVCDLEGQVVSRSRSLQELENLVK
jgi:nucleoredoxin